MTERKIELFIALIIYIISMSVLLAVVYNFLEHWQLSELNFFIAGGLLFLVSIGWGYVLTGILFAPNKEMEDRLSTLTNEIMHELNIPLSTIQANINLLKRTIEDEKSLKRIQRIEDASLRLQKLYDELVYTIRKEIHPVSKESFDVQYIIEERVAICKEQKRHTFELSLFSYEIEADKIGFEQMIDNILINAMKYSSKNSTISITLKENQLCIKDEGIGMTTAELLRVHERYFQGDTRKEGEGIGLTLVKTYCDNEDIDIVIHSEKDVGTEICLDFVKIHS